MTDIPERLRAIVSSPDVAPPLAPLLAIAEEVQALADELASAKEKLRIAEAHLKAHVKYTMQQDDTLGKIYDLINDSGQSLAMFVVQELHPDEFTPPVVPAPPEPVYCEECDNDITYDCSTCAPVVDSTDFVELPETD